MSWFAELLSPKCLGWAVAPETEQAHSGVIRIELAHHCVTQYVGRITGDCTFDAAPAELHAVICCGRVLPEAPTWFDDYTYGGVPAYWVIVDDWLVLPLAPSSRPCPDVYIALSCMHRGMQIRGHRPARH